MADVRVANAQAVRESREGIWYLKEVMFNGKPVKIITQNYNGPCSFIAICNILVLRGDITIAPPERTSVSYEFLSQLVADYLLHASPDVDISAALSMMPLTQKGMDLNPLFTSPTAFRPAGDNGALKLFEQARIQLVHGWLSDPESPEHNAVSAVEDYDNAVNLIVMADHLTKGRLVMDDNAAGSATTGPSSPSADQLSPEEKRQIEDAMIVRQFLETTSSQLTYHGLFTLTSTLKPGDLVALFRNSHLSVLHRPSEENSAIYSLVTDMVFYNEGSVVWEHLDDVDGSSSSFVDSDFKRSSPAGGDFAGHTAESALAALEAERAANAPFDPADRELARQLQAEEDEYARRLYAERERMRVEQLRRRDAQSNNGGDQNQQNKTSRWFPNRQQRQPPQVDPGSAPLSEAMYDLSLGPNAPENAYITGQYSGRAERNGRNGSGFKPKNKDSCIVM